MTTRNEAAEWSDEADRAAIDAAYEKAEKASTLRALLEAHAELHGSCERELRLLDAALAAERRATVERIKRRLEEDAPDTIGFRIWAILDEEATR